MKKIFFLSVLMLVFAGAVNAQSMMYPPAPTSGNFTNGSGPVWYTPTLTLTNTGADSAKCKIGPGPNNWIFQSLTYTVDMTLTSGTGAGKVRFFVSGDTGTPTSYNCIDSATITNTTNQTWTKVITGNPYTNYLITVTGSGTEGLSTVVSLLER